MKAKLLFEVSRYLEKRAIRGPWALCGGFEAPCAGAVIIPSLAEGDGLFATLQSLARTHPVNGRRFLTVVVINQRVDAQDSDRIQNRADLARLVSTAADYNFPLAWIDAASPGRELPAQKGGVGMARKIGMDFALSCLDWERKPFLASLDADTLVEPNYLDTLCSYFASGSLAAVVLPVHHQPASNPRQQAAIDRYELFLRSYVLGLSLAGSPYAFMTFGSAMACTATAYVRCGGMNTRVAAEDFYFLDKLAKTVGVSNLYGTTVHPSARPSHRVPFGTGRSIYRQLKGEKEPLFYPLAAFKILGSWLDIVAHHPFETAEKLLGLAKAIQPSLAEYLEQAGWLDVWPKLGTHNKNRASKLSAFHAWFDGLKTLRLIHALCAAIHPRGEPSNVLPEFFAELQRPFPTDLQSQLKCLRHYQNRS